MKKIIVEICATLYILINQQIFALQKDKMWKALLTDARNRGILCRMDTNATPSMIKKYIIK